MILSFIAALQLAATVPALQIESITTNESSMPGAPAQTPAGSTTKSIMIVAGRNMRVDEIGHTGPVRGSQTGTVMIMRGDKKKIYGLDTAKKEYYELDLAKMQSQVGAMLKSMPGMEMKFSDLKATVQDLGEGETLLGHPTRHFKVTNSMTMNAMMQAESLSISMESTSDAYYAKDIPLDESSMMAGDTSMLSQFRDLIPGVNAQKFRDEFKKLPKLVPLKSVNMMSSYFGPMDVTVKVTQVVTKVEKKQVPASIFEIPAGYRKIEMPALAGPMRQ